MKAVIDRFEGDYAVVLFGDEEIKVDIPKELLPQEPREYGVACAQTLCGFPTY